MLVIVICLLIETEPLSLKPTIKMLTFQYNFVLEANVMGFILLSPENYL